MTMSTLLTSRTSTQESHREREGGHGEENDREPQSVKVCQLGLKHQKPQLKVQ